MYRQIETAPEVFMGSASIMNPVATLQDECGGTFHIIIDDHCYVLCMEDEDGLCRPATHIFREAFEVLKQLPIPY